MILARREAGEESVFNLNEMIEGLDGFLRSTIGEHIRVERKLSPTSGRSSRTRPGSSRC